MGKSHRYNLSAVDIFFIQVQKVIDWITFLVLGTSVVFYIRFIHKNKITNHSELRKTFRNLTKDRSPLMICSNHLTMFDSIYIQYALNGVLGYLLNFRLFSWNIPAREVFRAGLFLAVFTYLGKCISIDRQGSGEHHRKVLNKIRYLLDRGEVCTIFPEGRRSRTGRLETENVTYGIGSILADMPHARVLCVYLRGENQTTCTPMPHRGDDMYFSIKLITPVTQLTGKRAARDISIQIMQNIKEMEDEYFVAKGNEPSVLCGQ